MIFVFPLLLDVSAVLTISDFGTHCFMGPLRLVVEVLLFTSCTLCCEFDSFWLTYTLGLTPFGFDSQEATTILFFWNLDFKDTRLLFQQTLRNRFWSLQNLDLWSFRIKVCHCLRLRVLWLGSILNLRTGSFRFWLNHSFKLSTFRYKECWNKGCFSKSPLEFWW